MSSNPIAPTDINDAANLFADGYAIVRAAADPALVAEIEADFADRYEATPFCEGSFYGERTKRFGRLLIRSPHVADLVMNSPILALAEAALGPWCDRIQLNLAQAIELHPGALAQFPHRDQDMWAGEIGRMEYLVNVMWPLTPFRRRYQPTYSDALGDVAIAPERLKEAIKALVGENSEGGRRAQAVAAGLFDLFAGPDRVESGRINDPSRRYPGDVCVRSAADPDVWEKSVEVRDKPVRAADVRIFGAKCIAMGVREAAVLMAAAAQPPLDEDELAGWAAKQGLSLTLFHGWDDLVSQILFWSALPKLAAASAVVDYVQARLVIVEASPGAITTWQKLVAG